MYKIAVLGDRDSIYGFASLGLDVCPAEDLTEAAGKLKRLAEEDYAVIYVTEAVFEGLASEISRYESQQIPAVIPIPGVSGNTGIGMLNVKKTVEQAVGSDIIFNSENERSR
ncbi:MAG: V-type ATP synthase subunit F [Oscillospiraceae bacterium]|jgi:V/A-type H+-transporting ATPase subunit F|nr:V-type ATP synthase subunit F [Oscillospiraceae bacterium]